LGGAVFLRNNNQKWFNEHKSDFQQAVVQPVCAFIDAVAPRLRKISAHLIADCLPWHHIP
jgi:uncharacterized protein (DUF2461 family)